MRFRHLVTVSVLTFATAPLTLALPAHAADIPIHARSGITRIFPDTGLGRLTKLVARAPKGTTFSIPAAGSSSDPRTPGTTSSFRRCISSDPNTASWTPIPLPIAGWKGLGNPAGSRGYKYRGAGTVADPCKVILVKDRVIRAVCRGTGAVDPSFILPVGADHVSDELILGDTRYCTDFGPETYLRDSSFRGFWKGRNAPAPASCPDLDPDDPPYGSASRAFMRPAPSLLSHAR